MKKALLIVALVGIPIVIFSQAHATTTENFIEKASMAGEFELQSSRLALVRSKNPEVKAFAQQMIDDHTEVAKNLNFAAKTAGLESSLKTSLDPVHQDAINALDKLTGKNFDDRYIDEQVTAHRDAVTLFGDYSTSGDDKTIQDFATETLPALQTHLDHIQQLEQKK